MSVAVEQVDFDQLTKWSVDSEGNFVHDSGKFFRICGASAYNTKNKQTSYQPVIDQPEQGILGITTRNNNGRLELLLQAKIEPGNLGSVQYSPTVQATKSNYTRAHKGKSVPYIDDFMFDSSKVMNRGFQSEHGYKFYRKANDNVHVHDDNAQPLDDRFMWLSLNDVRHLLSKEHCMNMDTRSVLATIDFIGRPLTQKEIQSELDFKNNLEHDLLLSSLTDHGSVHTTEELVDWVTRSKENKAIQHCLLPLNSMTEKGWNITKNNISSLNNKHFELVGVKTSINSREVSSWCQPIVKDNVPKIYAFLMKKINNIIHVCVRMFEEDYSWSGPELSPTLHSVESRLSLYDKLLSIGLNYNNCKIVYDKYQSEEGGRFLEQKNKYMLMLVNEDVELVTPNNFRWMTLYQLKNMTKMECSVNIEARTLLAIASYYKGGLNAN